LGRLHQLDSGQVVRLRMQGSYNPPNPGVANPKIGIKVETNGPLTAAEQAETRQVVRRMLRLNEDLTEFYQLSRQMDGWTLPLQPGGGRLLRCPNLFEDIVYTLCTTNIAWSGTIRMVDRLTAKLGQPFLGQDDWRAFPSPTAIAAAGPEFLKQETGLGYRSGYVWELASAVAEGRLDLTTFEDPNLSIDELHRSLRQIKGVGNYAAATILMLLGRYEYLAIDSEMRAFVSKKYFNGQAASDIQIQETYAPWGRWQYLAYWFDPPQ
jgi:3-methyladenine DNA glycosylase/8-oxoguanine DNA glycosylase